MPHHDLQCNKCGLIIHNHYESPWPSSIRHDDGGELEILWHSSSPSCVSVHPRERTVIYRDPITGQVAYPGRNDAPTHYSEAGWERVEFEHARDLEQFEREHNVLNENLWYNSGNGAE